MKNTEYKQAAMEIYLNFKDRPGSFSGVSGHLKRNDSTKLSRQLNPTDERRANPFEEVMEIQKASMLFSPELEQLNWNILERERGRHRSELPETRIRRAELFNRIITELADVIFVNDTGGSPEKLEKEGFELMQAVKVYYENIKVNRERDE